MIGARINKIKYLLMGTRKLNCRCPRCDKFLQNKGNYCSKCSNILSKRRRKDMGLDKIYRQRPEVIVRLKEAQKRYLLRLKKKKEVNENGM